MGVIHRRQIQLVQAGMQRINVEKRQWLRAQGVDRPEELPRRSLWYHPDGSSALGPSDPYHLRLYRGKGFTLKPLTTPVKSPKVRRATMARLASRVLPLLGHGDSWDGTPSELAASGVGSSFSPEGFSRVLSAPKVSVALASAGITMARGYRGKERVLRLERLRG